MTQESPDNQSDRYRKRKRRKHRRHQGNRHSKKTWADGLMVFLVVAVFLIALGFCLWMIVPPLLEYIGQGGYW